MKSKVFLTAFATIADNIANIKKEEALCDKEISSIYHTLEYVKLNAAQQAKLTKKLKEVLSRRRWAKHAMAVINSFESCGLDGARRTLQRNLERDSKYSEESYEYYKNLLVCED